MLLLGEVVLEVHTLEGCDKTLLLQQLKKGQTVREFNVEAVRQLFPVLQVIDVVNELGVVKVAMLSEVCGVGRACTTTSSKVAGQHRVGRDTRARTVQILRVGERLHELELNLEALPLGVGCR